MASKEAVCQASRDAGGVMQVDSLSDLPRGSRQGYYRNQVKKKEGASTSLSSRKGKGCWATRGSVKDQKRRGTFYSGGLSGKGKPHHRSCIRKPVSRVGKVQHIRTGLLHCSTSSHIQSGAIRMYTDFLQKPLAKKQEKWYISSKAVAPFWFTIEKTRRLFENSSRLSLMQNRTSRKFCLLARMGRSRWSTQSKAFFQRRTKEVWGVLNISRITWNLPLARLA